MLCPWIFSPRGASTNCTIASGFAEGQGKLDEAEEKLKEAIRLAPKNDFVMRDGMKYALAEFYLRHNRPSDAEKLAQDCLKIK